MRARLEALSAYLVLTDVARSDLHRYWNEHLGVDRGRGRGAEPEFFARMALWYGTLWVVAEGWLDLNIRDQHLDALLTPERQELLRRFRNKTFHAQQTWPHPHLLAYVDSDDSVAWSYALETALRSSIDRALGA